MAQIHQLLPSNPSRACREKLRNRARHLRLLRDDMLSHIASLEFDSDAWFNDWHHHVDWYGYGNLSWRMRSSYLAILAEGYQALAAPLADLDRPYQLYLAISRSDSADDAVYVHSPNPHSPFPRVYTADWNAAPEVEQHFRALMPGCDVQAGLHHAGDEELYLVYSRGIGLSLEAEGA